MGFFGDISENARQSNRAISVPLGDLGNSATLRSVANFGQSVGAGDAGRALGSSAAIVPGVARDVVAGFGAIPQAASNAIESYGVGDAFKSSLGIGSTSPSAPSQSGGAALTAAAAPALPQKVDISQPQAAASNPQQASQPAPRPIGVGLNGQPLQGAAAATYAGRQPNGTPIFQFANPDGLDHAGRIANEAKHGIPTPASGYFDQAAADQNAARLAALSAQGDYFRQSRLQNELAASGNPAVLQAAAAMAPSVSAAQANYGKMLAQSMGGSGQAKLTPEMQQQLAFESAKIGLQANTPRGLAEARMERKQSDIDKLTKALSVEKDPGKRNEIKQILSGYGVTSQNEAPTLISQFTTPEGVADAWVFDKAQGKVVKLSELAQAATAIRPFGNLGLPPQQ